MTPSQSAKVRQISTFSATDEVKILFRDGSSQIVKPVNARIEGPLGPIFFSKDLVWNNGKVYIPNTGAGPLIIQFACYITPSVFFERCISQGSHEPAKFAGVRMNLNSKALTFFEKNICSRTDRSPTNF